MQSAQPTKLLLKSEPFLHLALIAGAILPVIATGGIALIDLPIHLSRQYLNQKLIWGPGESAFWEWKFALLPNMTIDLWSIALMPLIGVQAAVTLFISSAMVIIYAGVQLIRTVLYGRPSLLIGVLSIYLLYTGPLLWGFLNYIFGTGIMLLAIALFECDRQRPRPWFPWIQCGLLVLCFASSIFPLGLFYAYAFGRIAPDLLPAADAGRRRSAFMAALRTAPAVGLTLLLVAASQIEPPWTQVGGILNKTEWGFRYKIHALNSFIVFERTPLEVASFAVFALVVALLLITSHLRIPKRFHAPLAMLTLAFMVVPGWVKGVAYTDYRLPFAIGMVVLACIDVRHDWRTAPRYLTVALLSGAVLADAFRVGVIWHEWRLARDVGRDIRSVTSKISGPSMLLVAYDYTDRYKQGTTVMNLQYLALESGDFYIPSFPQNFFVRQRADIPASLISMGPLMWPEMTPRDLCGPYDHLLLVGPAASRPHESFPMTAVAEAPLATLYRIDRDRLPPDCRPAG